MRCEKPPHICAMNVLEYFKPIKAFMFDVDGVLTDGSVILLENGLQARTMNVKDGLALQMALKAGYRVIIVSGGSSEPVRGRLRYLGLEDVHLGLKDKLKFLEQLKEQYSLDWNEILYMGDDLPDLAVLEKVGLSCCPADAVAEVKSIVKYISPVEGGKGAVRDVIEKVLKVNHHWRYVPEITSR
ncbi:KdsC family phosphatase [Flavisolibacter ginsenosidimutans]|nr:HAD-IIIA family hydrolase [Flavisolibacter ginsenosidimutans]